MTDITKLLDEHPLPWTGSDGKFDLEEWRVCDAKGRVVGGWALPTIIAALANALHAERQKNAAPANDSGDVDALRYRIGELERRVRAVESEPLEINDLRDEIRWLDNFLWSVLVSIRKGDIKHPQDLTSWIDAGIERRGMYADIVRYRREARGSDD